MELPGNQPGCETRRFAPSRGGQRAPARGSRINVFRHPACAGRLQPSSCSKTPYSDREQSAEQARNQELQNVTSGPRIHIGVDVPERYQGDSHKKRGDDQYLPARRSHRARSPPQIPKTLIKRIDYVPSESAARTKTGYASRIPVVKVHRCDPVCIPEVRRLSPGDTSIGPFPATARCGRCGKAAGRQPRTKRA